MTATDFIGRYNQKIESVSEDRSIGPFAHLCLPPHCRCVVFSSCRSGPPSYLLIAGMSSFLAGLAHPHGSHLPPYSGMLSFLAGLVHPHWCLLPHCRYAVFSCRFGPPSLELPASSLQVCRLFLQVWSTLTGASCLLIAGMASFLLAGLVHPHWSFLPPHCRCVVFSSCRSGTPSLELLYLPPHCRYIIFSSCRSGPPSLELLYLPPHCRYAVFSCRSGPPSVGPPASSFQVPHLFLKGYSLQGMYPPFFFHFNVQ